MRHLWLLARRTSWASGSVPVGSIEEHLRAAAEWLLRAQAATPDDGVAHSYDVRAGKWLASYPETTGYIIPTLYDYARHFDAPALRRRRAPNGAVGSGRTTSRWRRPRRNDGRGGRRADRFQHGAGAVRPGARRHRKPATSASGPR